MMNSRLPPKAALKWNVLPLPSSDERAVSIATTHPEDIDLLQNVSAWLGRPVVAVRWPVEKLRAALLKQYGFGADSINDLVPDPPDEQLTGLSASNEEGMIKFVNDLIKQAHRDRATDIHIEPYDDDLSVRFRIDGLLYPVPIPPSLNRLRALLTSRIKLMAQMDIAEKRLPQDGRIRFFAENEDIDIRVSTIPTVNGESLDLRLLPRHRLIRGLEDLGMRADLLEQMSTLIRKPNGVILVTGPTGHGKTTTLYACLSRINSSDKKIITIEDPVEYQLKGINQLQVQPKIGLGFSSGLRSVLRQDPDVIMVGEIRDRDTAEVAVRASLTGHLVFSTLHTTNATGAITRLIDMGIEPYLVASSLKAVLGQRLIRLTCGRCEGRAEGCDYCFGTGYRNRTGIFELFSINDESRRLIQEGAHPSRLHEYAASNGMTTLFEDGSAKVKKKKTTTQELLRVTEENG